MYTGSPVVGSGVGTAAQAPATVLGVDGAASDPCAALAPGELPGAEQADAQAANAAASTRARVRFNDFPRGIA
jgi:hypothetical protein